MKTDTEKKNPDWKGICERVWKYSCNGECLFNEKLENTAPLYCPSKYEWQVEVCYSSICKKTCQMKSLSVGNKDDLYKCYRDLLIKLTDSVWFCRPVPDKPAAVPTLDYDTEEELLFKLEVMGLA